MIASPLVALLAVALLGPSLLACGPKDADATAIAAPAAKAAAQEAPPAPAEPGGAPSQQAPPDEPVTSDAVREFLLAGQSQLYDPQAAGLESLSFELPYELPPLGKLGTILVQWSRDGGDSVNVRLADELPPGLPPGLPAEALEAKGREDGRQVLIAMLNRHVASLLETGVATMGTPEGELIPVRISDPVMASQGVSEQTVLFDDDGVPQQSRTKIAADQMNVTIVQLWSWKPADAGAEGLLLASQAGEMDMGIMKQSTTTTFEHAVVDGIVLVSRVTSRADLPEMMGGPQVQTMEVTSLVVNGKPAGASPAPQDG